MPSFEIIYEERDDVLEVSFGFFEEDFPRSISLNEAIVLHTDSGLTAVLGITFYSFARLLGVGETQMDRLTSLSEIEARRVLMLLSQPPADSFLEVVDAENLLARVEAPNLQDLLRA
jgi:hypothetical protein